MTTSGAAAACRQYPCSEAGIKDILRHGAIGCPLATGHGDESIGICHDRVLARQTLGVSRVPIGCHQWSQSYPDAAYVPALQRAAQHLAGLFQDEVQFLFERLRFSRQILPGRISGAEDDRAHPGHGEQHATVLCLGYQQGMLSGHEGAIHDYVYALTGRDQPLGSSQSAAARGLLSQLIDPDACGIDDCACLQGEGLS